MSGMDDMAVAEYHLIGWGAWCRSESASAGIGYRSKSPGFRSGGCGFEDVDDLAAAEDAKAAQICDSIIWDMQPAQRTILECRYVLGNVLRSNRPDAEERLAEAILAFWDKAMRLLG